MQSLKLIDGGVVFQRRTRSRRPATARWLLVMLSTAALVGTGAWHFTETRKAEQALAYYPQ